MDAKDSKEESTEQSFCCEKCNERDEETKDRGRRVLEEWVRESADVQQAIQGQLGKSFRTKLIYAERGFQLNPGVAGAVSTWVLSANGLYDPDISGVGHQCAGFDQIMEFFDHYTVISSKIYIDFSNRDTTNRQMVGVFVKDNSGVESDYRVIVENGIGSYSTLDFSGGGNDSVSLQSAVSISKFLGRPDVLSEDDLRGNDASNPARS